MHETCPWCGAKAVDMTTNDDLYSGDPRKRFICTGEDCHEWRDGEGPESEYEPLIILA